MVTVSFVDETTTGERGDGWHPEIFEEQPTLREVIRRRVFQEVAEFNADRSRPFQGLVRPRETERTLNGDPKTPPRLDPEEQCALAAAAFGRNRFVVLVGDRQVDDLDAEVELRQGIEITFLRLVPLVGG